MIPDTYKYLQVFCTKCWESLRAFSPKFVVENEELRWLGLQTHTGGGLWGQVLGSVVYHVRSNRVFVAGMLTFWQGLDNYGKMLQYRDINGFDLQDQTTYKRLID